MLDKTVIDSAVNKKYSDFSDSIKKELMSKMSNHPEAQAYAKDYDNIQDMKQKFAVITDTSDGE